MSDPQKEIDYLLSTGSISTKKLAELTKKRDDKKIINRLRKLLISARDDSINKKAL